MDAINNPEEFMGILQMSIAPAALIPGVALLLLSMTDRFGRVTQRARELGRLIHTVPREEVARIDMQIKILLRRSKIQRAAINLSLLSILFASILIGALFFAYPIKPPTQHYLTGLFSMSFITVLTSIGLFIGDFNLSLSALKLELEPHLNISADRPATWTPPVQAEPGSAVSAGFISKPEQPEIPGVVGKH